MATLRGLYRDGKLRAVAASHDFIGGLVDLKFEPTGRYPVILGASAYGKGEDDERLHVNATAAHTGTAIMYNYRTGAMTTHRAHGLNTVTEVDFLRDGSMGFTAGYDGNVFAWKTNSFDAAPERLQILRSHKSVSVERLQASKYFDVIACAANNKQKGDKTVDETKGEIVVVSFTTSRSSFSAFSAPPSSSSSSSSADAMEDPDAMDDDSDMDYDGTSEIGASFIRGNGGSNSNGEGKFEVLHPFESHKFACNDLTFGCVGYESWLMCACKNGTVMANDITCCSGGGSGGDKAMIVFESWVPVSALACAARTQLGAFGTEDGVVRTWDPRAPGAIATTPSLGADFNCMSFDPTDTLLQCSAMNSAVYIFDVRKVGVPLRVLRHNPPGGKSSCGVPMSRWSPAGFLFSCGDDSTLRIWDLAAGDPLLRTIRTHSDSVSCMAISPDESLVVSGDDSKRVVLHSFLPKRGNADIDEDTELDDAKYDRFAGAVGPIKV